MLKASTSECTLNGIVRKSQPKMYGTLPRNNFRGIKKDELRRQTSMYLASLTVISIFLFIIL